MKCNWNSLPFLLALVLILAPTVTVAEDEVSDPLEPVNRVIFEFNDTVDVYLLKPVAEGYEAVMPEFAQTGVRNFFANLEYPSHLLSDVIQLKFDQAATHTGRFLINSTLGIGGLLDLASPMGLQPHEEDFGTALGHYGVPPGPYLVLPLLGPSTVRDGVGRVVDSSIHPFAILEYTHDSDNLNDVIRWGARPLDIIQTRADLLTAIEAAKESAVDYYLFVQSAYYQRRKALIHDTSERTDEELLDDEDF